MPVSCVSFQKHLGVYLDEKLNFNYYIIGKNVSSNEENRCYKLSNVLPAYSLITIYNSFVRPHLDYDDILYGQPSNDCLCQKIENNQHNAFIAITGAIRATSQMKLYNESGFESLKFK